MTHSRSRVALLGLIALLALTACGDTDRDAGEPLAVVRSPQFVNRMVPGSRPLAIVSALNQEGDDAELSGVSSLAGMTVSFVPVTLAAGTSAEVWVNVPEVGEDTPFTVTVTVARGDETETVTIDATAVPGTDDLADTARQIAAVFLDRVHDQVQGLPAEPTGLTNGTPVAGLLVVSHYAWFTDVYEIGLAWHIMIAPDDFAELYVRPRGSSAPIRAFRINSWSTAVGGGSYELTEIAAPAEVTR